MQKELKILLDNFVSWTSIQPILLNEEKLASIVNYLNNSYLSDIEEIRQNIIPNLFLFETEDKTFKVEKAREIVEKSTIKSSFEFNIFVIREVDKLSIWASNSLLKVLEDIPPRLIFILTTSAKENLLDTIKSRILDFWSNSIQFEISSETQIAIDEFFLWNKTSFISMLFWEKIERHEYIAILEYILTKINHNPKYSQDIYEKIITWISSIYSSNVNPKYILDSIVLDID